MSVGDLPDDDEAALLLLDNIALQMYGFHSLAGIDDTRLAQNVRIVERNVQRLLEERLTNHWLAAAESQMSFAEFVSRSPGLAHIRRLLLAGELKRVGEVFRPEARS